MRPLEPPLRGPAADRDPAIRERPPGSRPSLRGGSLRPLPGSPQIAIPGGGVPDRAVDRGAIAQPGADGTRRRNGRAQWLQWLRYAVPGRDRRALRADPAPSRLAYRLHRLWLTPLFRRGLTLGLPVLGAALALGLTLTDAERQQAWRDRVDRIHAGFIDRPEFAVTGVDVHNASPALERAVRARIEAEFPISSFRLDLVALRSRIEALDAVARVDLRIAAGVLDVQVSERVPAVVWRAPEGLKLLDVEGQRIARLRARSARADLPLLAGRGANEHVAEALALLLAAEPLAERVRGLVRVGERRWDLVLDRDQRIMLPETGALEAVERAVALQQAEEVLAREVAALDLRLTRRPVVRLTPGAVEAFHALR